MSNEHNILQKTTQKLGIKNDLVNKKTKELLRILRGKGSMIALSDSAKLILCLDLATTCLGINFDRESSIRLSGLKKSVYQNSLHTVEKILELDKPLTISELCVQFSCTGVKDLAENIFEKYRNSNKADVGHPQYAAASVYTACRLKNVKVQKTQFLPTSHLKPSQWKELTDEFDKFVISTGIASPKKNKNKEGNRTESVDMNIENSEETINFRRESKEEECEPYEVWKERILSAAYAALKNEEKMQE